MTAMNNPRQDKEESDRERDRILMWNAEEEEGGRNQRVKIAEVELQDNV